MSALPTGSHTLYLTATDTSSKFWKYRAKCSRDCIWTAANVTRKQARELHDAHIQAVLSGGGCDPDCAERIACPKAGEIGHSDCGNRPCGCPRHHLCGCASAVLSETEANNAR